MDLPVHNPAMPYTAPIIGGFNPGRMLRIQGTAHPSARCFAINLQCGPNVNPRDDIALHLSPVFSPPPRVVRNSLQSHVWGPEESHGVYYPFSPGQSWEILILSESDHFKIAINGQHFTEFYYRLPLQRVTHLAIDGETSISMLQFSGNTSSQPAGYGQPYGNVPSPQMPPSIPFPPPMGGTSPYSGGGSPNPYASPYPPPPSPAYPGQGSPYMGARAPSPNPYPMQQGYPPPPVAVGYPHSPSHGHHSGGLLSAGLGAATGILAGKKSKAIPIGLGVGAGALAGAALLGGPLKPKKMKKLLKHKHKHKWSHKWGHKWGHKHKWGGGGWGGRSSSSSD